VNPWEDASRGKAVSCNGQRACTAKWTYAGKTGEHNLAVQYFDLQGGAAQFTLTVNGKTVGLDPAWKADAMLPSNRPDGDNSTRHVVRDVELKPGDVICVQGTPDGTDRAALDYIEVLPASNLP